MAHVCTTCHPDGVWHPENEHVHDDDVRKCCPDCGCGWWRETPAEPPAEPSSTIDQSA